MRVGELMRREIVAVGPTHRLREAAEQMAAHNVGCAIVQTDEAPGIISERDVLRAVAQGADLEQATVSEYMTWNAVVAYTNWDVETAARAMLRGGFRHLVVVEDDRIAGILSIRDLAAHLFPEVADGASRAI